MALPATEAFTGGAGPVGANWTQQRTTRTVNRDGAGLGKQDAIDNTADVMAFWSADSFASDHYSQVTVVTFGNASFSCNVSVRASGSGDAAWNAYDFYTNGSSGAGNTELAKVISGSATVLRNFTTTVANGDTLKATATGTTLEYFKNGVSVGTQVDSAIPSGGSPGVGSFEGTGATIATTFDNWQGDNIGVAPVGFGGTRRAFGGRGSSRAINSPSGPFDQRGFLRQRIWDYTLMAVAAGTIFNADVSESLTATDTQTAQADFSSVRSDALTAADTQTGSALFSVARSDALAVADTETGLLSFSVSVTEALAVADTETAQAVFASARTDTLTAADSQTTSAVFASTRTEALTAADSQTGAAVFASTLTESLTAADSETASAVFSVARVESLTVADSSDGNVGAATYNVTRTEALTAADSETSSAVFASTRPEALAASDSEVATAILAVTRTEAVTVADSETAASTMGAAQSESLSAVESSTGVVAGGLVDAFTFRITGNPVMTATLTAQGVLVASLSGGAVLTDTISGGPV